MKKIISVLLAVVLAGAIFAVGCYENCSGLMPYKEEKTSGDYVYRIFDANADYDYEHIAIIGLSEEGQQKRELLIPEEIDGIPVVCLGYASSWTAREGSFDSDVLEKIFIVKPYDSISQIFLGKSPNLKKIIMLNSFTYEGFNQRHNDKELLPKIEALKLNIVNNECYANVVYYLNNGGEEICFADDCDGEKITFVPPAPQREGYTFGGWYKEKECINEWDFEKDEVPAKKYDEENNYLFQETSLYAKWNKKNT